MASILDVPSSSRGLARRSPARARSGLASRYRVAQPVRNQNRPRVWQNQAAQRGTAVNKNPRGGMSYTTGGASNVVTNAISNAAKGIGRAMTRAYQNQQIRSYQNSGNRVGRTGRASQARRPDYSVPSYAGNQIPAGGPYITQIPQTQQPGMPLTYNRPGGRVSLAGHGFVQGQRMPGEYADLYGGYSPLMWSKMMANGGWGMDDITSATFASTDPYNVNSRNIRDMLNASIYEEGRVFNDQYPIVEPLEDYGGYDYGGYGGYGGGGGYDYTPEPEIKHWWNQMAQWSLSPADYNKG